MTALGRWLARWGFSRDVLSRIGLLFGTLSLIKAVMLVVFQRHLFDTYWRVETQLSNWVNYAAFFLFAFLVGLSLWKLARRYETAGAQVFRVVNAVVVALATVFIFLSFHEGDQAHLHPLMTGLFNRADLLPYYSLNLFFRLPFLAGWIVAYAATYYWLARTGGERFILRATAVFGAAYTALCLRDLIAYREELIVADALGIACVLCFRRDNSPLNWLWALLPVGLIGVVLFRCSGYSDLLSSPQPEGIVLVGGSLVLFVGTSVLAWRCGFHSGWSWLVTFAGISFVLFVNANYPSAANYRNLMCLAVTLPRYFLSEFGLALVMLITAACYRRWRPAGSLLWLDVFIVGLITLAFVDLRLSQIMGARLDWDLLSLALGEGPRMMWRMVWPYLPIVTVFLVGIIVVYVCALRGIQRWILRPENSSALKRFNPGYAVVAFLLLGLAGRFSLGTDKVVGQTVEVLARSSPFGRSAASRVMGEGEFKETARQLGMEQMVSAPPPSASGETIRDLNVLFILLESTFNEHLSLFNGQHETQPLLSQYKDRMELFPNFYSSFAGSINAQFANFTGLYPVRDYKTFTLQRVAVKSVFEVLHENGYATSLFTSTYLDYSGFRDFLRGRDVDEMFDADNMPGAQKAKQVSWGLREEETLAAMQQQIRKYASAKRTFFMTYIPVAPHYPYDGTPERFRKYRPKEYKNFTEYYLNDLLFMDWIVASILDELKSSGLLERTLVVITGDHGEMLGAGGGPVGHGWALTPELANVPLIIMDPTKPGATVNETVGSHVDLLPTILDKLGIPTPANQLYQGVSLYSAKAQEERTIYLNTFSQYAVMQGRKLVFGDRQTKRGDGAKRGRTSFTMQNEGARSVFVETETPLAAPLSISDFDAFQENFLRNYSHYCGIIRPAKTELSSVSK